MPKGNKEIAEVGMRVIVKPPLKKPSYWIRIIMPFLLYIPACLLYALLAASDNGLIVLPCVALIFGLIGIMWIMFASLYGFRLPGVIADGRGLTFEKLWQASSRQTFEWSTIRALEIDFDRRFLRARRSSTVQLTIQDESGGHVVSCPYDVALFRAIVSRAKLDLRKQPENWQSEADDPFEMLQKWRFSEQHWLWSRS